MLLNYSNYKLHLIYKKNMRKKLSKQQEKFIDSLIDAEKRCYDAWVFDSVLANQFNKNLFCIFSNRVEVKNYLINL